MQERPIAVLGATGSVGRQALEVAEALGARITLLSAHSSVKEAEAAVRRHRPDCIVMTDKTAAHDLSTRLRDTATTVIAGKEGLLEAIAADKAGVYVNSILGSAGLLPSLSVIEKGARLALANKETMVVAGKLVRERAAACRAEILPVDSEHSAIFQSLHAGRPCEVKKLILTASGGPFRGYTRERLATVTRDEALAHPTWQMGAKITVDSATMMNKGFEVIEAVRLFDVPPERIEVVVHPESIIHSAVEYIDNTVVAEMSVPDMRACVQYALTYPERCAGKTPTLDLAALGGLTFARPDPVAFPLLPLAYEAVRRGGTAPAALNAADEVAVAAFLDGTIAFGAIADVVAETLAAVATPAEDLASILEADRTARSVATALITKYAAR